MFCLLDYGGLIVCRLLISSSIFDLFFIFTHARKGWCSMSEKGRKKAADSFSRITDLNRI